jgi:hypothetical protein
MNYREVKSAPEGLNRFFGYGSGLKKRKLLFKMNSPFAFEYSSVYWFRFAEE